MASHGVPRTSAPTERTPQAQAAELQKIQEYKDLVELVNTKIRQREYTADTLALISKLLKRNPEYYSIWNHRRLVLQQLFSDAQQAAQIKQPITSSNDTTSHPESTPDNATTDAAPATHPTQYPASEQIELLLISDLHFLVPLLREFPKCYWIWNHRQWLLQQATHLLPVPRVRRLWQEELGLVAKMLSMDSRNFHGWGYRRRVVAELESPELQGTSMAEDEFSYTTKMIKTSLSNFSAWHYRSKLIPRLLNERGASREERRKFLDSEFNLIQNALWTDSADQSLWFYHAFLMSELSTTPSTSSSSSSSSPSTSSSSAIIPDLSPTERVALLSRELDNIKEMLEDEDEDDTDTAPAERKYIYHALVQSTLEKQKWIRAVEAHAEPKAIADDKDEVQSWISKLRALDPFRMGRWDDVARQVDDLYA
ncbi:protein prenylyltransferase [Xylona heveae TC161]|uniref:Geranylgeranyl transferase type-2 subunit alpha n=1 Tax=Xylona heveae (strain CBS 132557 / TC161) TaxID=1328760 RepID=A0A165A3K1_XYLHT|nr:protein prenylyltransferase [Xylona heveae TC161]KZF19903.1 protein prenylyltransferase [Xylona heveae TC161]